MDRAGAVAGLLLAAGILYFGGTGQVALTRGNYQALVLLSVVPGVAAVLVLARWVHEQPRAASTATSSVRLAWRGARHPVQGLPGIPCDLHLGELERCLPDALRPDTRVSALAAFSLVVTLSSTPGGASRTGLDGAASLSRIGLFMR